MIDFPREVRADDNISATEFNRLVRAVRANYPLLGPGIKLRRTPGGTVISADAVRAAPAAASAPRVIPGAGCFALVEAPPISKSYGELVDCTFGNQYYKIGEVLRAANFSQTVSSLIGITVIGPDSELEFDTEIETPFVALKIEATGATTASLEAYTDFSEMYSDSLDAAFVIVPLYKLDGETETYYEDSDTGHENPKCRVTIVVDVDFRNMPKAQMTEVL